MKRPHLSPRAQRAPRLGTRAAGTGPGASGGFSRLCKELCLSGTLARAASDSGRAGEADGWSVCLWVQTLRLGSSAAAGTGLRLSCRQGLAGAAPGALLQGWGGSPAVPSYAERQPLRGSFCRVALGSDSILIQRSYGPSFPVPNPLPHSWSAF